MLIKKMIRDVLLIITLTLALTVEESCLVLAVHCRRFRDLEIESFLETRKELDPTNFNERFIEDTYNECISKITPESKLVYADQIPEISEFYHLLNYSFDKYKSSPDLHPSESFSELKSSLMFSISLQIQSFQGSKEL
jgi:hypothetical protein